MRPVIKVKVAFRVIRDHCYSKRKTKRVLLSLCAFRKRARKRVVLKRYWFGVLVTSHESSTDNDSMNGESVQSAAQIGGKQGVEIVGVEG